MFKILFKVIKLRILNKLLAELCDGRSCRNCPAFMPDRSFDNTHCAQCHVIDQALKKWGPEKGVLNAG